MVVHGEKEKMMYSWSLNTRVLTAQIDLYTIHFLIVNTTVLNDFTFIFFFFFFFTTVLHNPSLVEFEGAEPSYG